MAVHECEEDSQSRQWYRTGNPNSALVQVSVDGNEAGDKTAGLLFPVKKAQMGVRAACSVWLVYCPRLWRYLSLKVRVRRVSRKFRRTQGTLSPVSACSLVYGL